MPDYLGKHRLGSFDCINHSCLPELETRLRQVSIRTLKIDGGNVSDRSTFMRQAEHDLPYPEWAMEMSRNYNHSPNFYTNWDSFNDIFWSCIADLNEREVAIIWTHIENMLVGGLQDFLDAVDSLTFVGRSLYNLTEPSQRVSLYCFFAGEGANFPVIEF